MTVALFAESSVDYVLRTMLRLGAPARDAEDLAHEVFVIAHRRMSAFDASRRVEPWLYGIAKNVLRDYRKSSRYRREQLDDGSIADHRHAPTRDADNADTLRRALAKLDEPMLDVIILCDLTELTVVETATELGVPEGTVKDRLRRAREQLRAAIEHSAKEVARAG